MTKARDLSQVPNASLGFKNRIINGNFDISQRGTSFTGVGIFNYTLDRMKAINSFTGGSTNITQQTDAPDANSKYSIRYTHATANTSSLSYYVNRQSIETQYIRDCAGSQVTLSFWYKSNRTGTHATAISPVGATGGFTAVATFTVNAANTWEYKTITSTAFVGVTAWGADNAEGAFVDVGFNFNGTGIASINSGDYFAISRMQLEKGSTATSFDYRPYGTELALCQRYYEKSYNIDVVAGAVSSLGAISNYVQLNGAYCTGGGLMGRFSVTKRTSPTVTAYSPSTGASGQINDGNAGADRAATVDLVGQSGFRAYCSTPAGNAANFTGHFVASAEL